MTAVRASRTNPSTIVLRTRQSLSPRSSNMSGRSRSSVEWETRYAAFWRASGSLDRACSMSWGSALIEIGARGLGGAWARGFSPRTLVPSYPRTRSSFRSRPDPLQVLALHLHELLERFVEDLRVAADAERHARIEVRPAFLDLVLEHIEEVVVAQSALHFVCVVDDDVERMRRARRRASSCSRGSLI